MWMRPVAIAAAMCALAGCATAADDLVVGADAAGSTSPRVEIERSANAPTSTSTTPPPAPEPEPDVTFLPPEAAAAPFELGDVTYDELAGCPDAPRGAVSDKQRQRYWLCMDGRAVTAELPMTTASADYGLPPVGTYEVFARDEDAFGIGGEALERFVAFYTTPSGNRIAFHEVVNQDPETVGDLDQRGQSAGCFRVREADSIQVWEFLQIGDPVAVIS